MSGKTEKHALQACACGLTDHWAMVPRDLCSDPTIGHGIFLFIIIIIKLQLVLNPCWAYLESTWLIDGPQQRPGEIGKKKL